MPNRQYILTPFGGTWNPIACWRSGEAYLKEIVDEQCRKINSMSTAELSNYVDYVTGSNIRSRTLTIAVSFWHCFAFDDNYGVDSRVLVRTVKSILDCIESRLKAEWEKFTKNEPGLTTLKEIMSENITTSEHTVFYLVHKRMKTMNRIDQPIQFDKPKGLKKTLVKLQESYNQVANFILDFDDHIALMRRYPSVEAMGRYHDENGGSIPKEAFRRDVEVTMERNVEQQPRRRRLPRADQRPHPQLNENAAPSAPKRRRVAPSRLNIASTKGHSYQ